MIEPQSVFQLDCCFVDISGGVEIIPGVGGGTACRSAENQGSSRTCGQVEKTPKVTGRTLFSARNSAYRVRLNYLDIPEWLHLELGRNARISGAGLQVLALKSSPL